MIAVASRAARVLLDTSAFINFAEGGALFQLAGYLGERAAITLDVDVEVRRNSVGRFPALKTLTMLNWPVAEPLSLPPELLADAEALRRLHASAGVHERANRGEIATALLAGKLGDALVIIDDELGKRLCRTRAVPRLSSAQLAAEMVAAVVLDEHTGLRVFEVATPNGIGRAEFDHAVDRARQALA